MMKPVFHQSQRHVLMIVLVLIVPLFSSVPNSNISGDDRIATGRHVIIGILVEASSTSETEKWNYKLSGDSNITEQKLVNITHLCETALLEHSINNNLLVSVKVQDNHFQNGTYLWIIGGNIHPEKETSDDQNQPYKNIRIQIQILRNEFSNAFLMINNFTLFNPNFMFNDKDSFLEISQNRFYWNREVTQEEKLTSWGGLQTGSAGVDYHTMNWTITFAIGFAEVYQWNGTKIVVENNFANLTTLRLGQNGAPFVAAIIGVNTFHLRGEKCCYRVKNNEFYSEGGGGWCLQQYGGKLTLQEGAVYQVTQNKCVSRAPLTIVASGGSVAIEFSGEVKIFLQNKSQLLLDSNQLSVEPHVANPNVPVYGFHFITNKNFRLQYGSVFSISNNSISTHSDSTEKGSFGVYFEASITFDSFSSFYLDNNTWNISHSAEKAMGVAQKQKIQFNGGSNFSMRENTIHLDSNKSFWRLLDDGDLDFSNVNITIADNVVRSKVASVTNCMMDRQPLYESALVQYSTSNNTDVTLRCNYLNTTLIGSSSFVNMSSQVSSSLLKELACGDTCCLGPSLFIDQADRYGCAVTFSFDIPTISGASTWQDGIGYSVIIEDDLPLKPLNVLPLPSKYQHWPEGYSNPDQAFFGGIYDGEYIWLVPGKSNSLIRMDPKTGNMTAYSNWTGAGMNSTKTDTQIFFGGCYTGSGNGEKDWIWLSPYTSDLPVVKVNRTSGEMTGYQSWPSGFVSGGSAPFGGMIYDGASLWLVPGSANMVVQVHKETGTMQGYENWPSSYSLCGNKVCFAGGFFDGSFVWFVPYFASLVIKLNPRTKEMSGYDNWPAGLLMPARLCAGAFDGQHIWMVPWTNQAVIKLDTKSGNMQKFDSWPSGFTLVANAFAAGVFDGQNVYLVPRNASSVLKIDKDTGSMQSVAWPLGFTNEGFGGAVFDGNSIWLFPASSNAVIRLCNTTSTMIAMWPDLIRCSSVFWFRGIDASAGLAYYYVILQDVRFVAFHLNGSYSNHDEGSSGVWTGCIDKSIPSLYSESRAMKMVTSVGNSTNSIFSGEPDAIRCVSTSGGNSTIFHLRKRYQYAHVGPEGWGCVDFETDGRFKSREGDDSAPCQGKSFSDLYAEGNAFNLVSSRGTGLSTLSGWPDAIRCGDNILHLHATLWYFQINSLVKTATYVLFSSSSKDYSSRGGPPTVTSDCVGDSISTLYSQGNAFNFVTSKDAGLGECTSTTFANVSTNQDGYGFSYFGKDEKQNPLNPVPLTTAVSTWPSGFSKTGNSFLGCIWDGEHVWLVPETSLAVIRLDPKTLEMKEYKNWTGSGIVKTSSKRFFGGIYDGDDGIWLSPKVDGVPVVKISRSNGEMTGYSTWPASFSPGTTMISGMVYDGYYMWLVPQDANMVVRVDKTDGNMVGFKNWPGGNFAKTDGAFRGGFWDGKSVWLIPGSVKHVVKLNPSTGNMIGYNDWPSGFSTTNGASLAGGAFDGHNLWMVPTVNDRVIKMDTTSGYMTGHMNWPSGFTLGGGFVGGSFDGEYIYLVPKGASRLLKTHKDGDGNFTNVGWPLGYTNPADNAFAGAVFDGKSIWFIPKEADVVMRLCNTTSTMVARTPDAFICGETTVYFFHTRDKVNRKITFFQVMPSEERAIHFRLSGAWDSISTAAENSGTATLCDGKGMSELVTANLTLNMLSGVQPSDDTSIFSGEPDVIRCLSHENSVILLYLNQQHVYVQVGNNANNEVHFNADGTFKSYKDTDAAWCKGKSLSDLYAEGNAFNLVTSKTKDESAEDSIVADWPDVIRCGKVVLWYHSGSSFTYYYQMNGKNTTHAPVYVSFASTGAYNNKSGSPTSSMEYCVGKSISALYTSGFAYNIVDQKGIDLGSCEKKKQEEQSTSSCPIPIKTNNNPLTSQLPFNFSSYSVTVIVDYNNTRWKQFSLAGYPINVALFPDFTNNRILGFFNVDKDAVKTLLQLSEAEVLQTGKPFCMTYWNPKNDSAYLLYATNTSILQIDLDVPEGAQTLSVKKVFPTSSSSNPLLYGPSQILSWNNSGVAIVWPYFSCITLLQPKEMSNNVSFESPNAEMNRNWIGQCNQAGSGSDKLQKPTGIVFPLHFEEDSFGLSFSRGFVLDDGALRYVKFVSGKYTINSAILSHVGKIFGMLPYNVTYGYFEILAMDSNDPSLYIVKAKTNGWSAEKSTLRMNITLDSRFNMTAVATMQNGSLLIIGVNNTEIGHLNADQVNDGNEVDSSVPQGGMYLTAGSRRIDSCDPFKLGKHNAPTYSPVRAWMWASFSGYSATPGRTQLNFSVLLEVGRSEEIQVTLQVVGNRSALYALSIGSLTINPYEVRGNTTFILKDETENGESVSSSASYIDVEPIMMLGPSNDYYLIDPQLRIYIQKNATELSIPGTMITNASQSLVGGNGVYTPWANFNFSNQEGSSALSSFNITQMVWVNSTMFNSEYSSEMYETIFFVTPDLHQIWRYLPYKNELALFCGIGTSGKGENLFVREGECRCTASLYKPRGIAYSELQKALVVTLPSTGSTGVCIVYVYLANQTLRKFGACVDEGTSGSIEEYYGMHRIEVSENTPILESQYQDIIIGTNPSLHCLQMSPLSSPESVSTFVGDCSTVAPIDSTQGTWGNTKFIRPMHLAYGPKADVVFVSEGLAGSSTGVQVIRLNFVQKTSKLIYSFSSFSCQGGRGGGFGCAAPVNVEGLYTVLGMKANWRDTLTSYPKLQTMLLYVLTNQSSEVIRFVHGVDESNLNKDPEDPDRILTNATLAASPTGAQSASLVLLKNGTLLLGRAAIDIQTTYGKNISDSVVWMQSYCCAEDGEEIPLYADDENVTRETTDTLYFQRIQNFTFPGNFSEKLQKKEIPGPYQMTPYYDGRSMLIAAGYSLYFDQEKNCHGTNDTTNAEKRNLYDHRVISTPDNETSSFFNQFFSLGGVYSFAQFVNVTGIYSAPVNFILTDQKLHCIRGFFNENNFPPFVVTIAGTCGSRGMQNEKGFHAKFNSPMQTASTRNQTVLYVADANNYRVRAIVLPSAGDGNNVRQRFEQWKVISTLSEVSTYAGNGSRGTNDGPRGAGATFYYPNAIVAAKLPYKRNEGSLSGEEEVLLFVVDNFNTIRKIHQGNVVTIVGESSSLGIYRNSKPFLSLQGIYADDDTHQGFYLFGTTAFGEMMYIVFDIHNVSSYQMAGETNWVQMSQTFPDYALNDDGTPKIYSFGITLNGTMFAAVRIEHL